MIKLLKHIFGLKDSADQQKQLKLEQQQLKLDQQEIQLKQQQLQLLQIEKQLKQQLEQQSTISTKIITEKEHITNNTLEVKRNEILEIINSKQVENPSSHWLDGYPEKQWEILSRLKNGKFLEDKDKISFFTTSNEAIGLTKNFLFKRDRNYAVYGSNGTYEIKKDLQNNGIFEITDRVGNYIKLKVDPMFNDTTFSEHILYSQIFSRKQLALISDGFLDNWFIPQYSIGITFIEKISENQYKLYFESLGLVRSKLRGYKFSGVISYGGEYHDWLEIIELMDKMKEERGLTLDYIESLEKYNHHNYL